MTVQTMLGIVALALIFFISGAHAADNGQWKGYHLTPYQQNWFSTVTVPQSDFICCTIADGYPVTAEPRGNHFWINYKGRWYQVPDAAVIHDHVNPIGVPIAWLKLVGDYVTGIRCFLNCSGSFAMLTATLRTPPDTQLSRILCRNSCHLFQ